MGPKPSTLTPKVKAPPFLALLVGDLAFELLGHAIGVVLALLLVTGAHLPVQIQLALLY